jgi:hypothetical protein
MSDLLSAASLLLAVVGVIYGLWYAEISSALDTKLPSRSHAEDRADVLKPIRRVFFAKAIPLSLGSGSIALVFLPPSVGIVCRFVNSLCRLGPSVILQYDAITTSFVMVEVFALALACLSLVRVLALWALIRK